VVSAGLSAGAVAKAATHASRRSLCAPRAARLPKVTWVNDDQAPHTATSDDGHTVDTGSLKPGRSKTITVGKAGTYSYHCTFHRFMVARVVVK
jgi:Cupredoxin-like domain